MKKLVIIGASGHGKVVADIALKSGYEDIVFLDDNENIKECAGFPVVGKTNQFNGFEEWDFFIAIGNAKIREQFQKRTPNIISLIHPNAVISRRVEIGEGTVVMAGAVINSDAIIGKGCIINTAASVDHDCEIGDYSHISVGTHIAGTCVIGKGTWVGAGATVSNNVKICSRSMIGAGTVVIKNIEEPGTYVGAPAKKVKMVMAKSEKTNMGELLHYSN